MSDEVKDKSPEHAVFSSVDSPQQISAAQPSTTSAPPDNVDEDDDFEFAFAVGNQETHPLITADEIFSDGQIRPIYPVFNRDLLLTCDEEKLCRQPLFQLLIEDREVSISHSDSPLGHDLEGIPPGSYCVWKPGSPKSPGMVRKSSSTGSSRRRRIRDFVVGRSHSDGKEKFMFIAAEEKSSIKKEVATDEGKRKGQEKKAAELDLITAHRVFYGSSGNRSTARGGGAAGRKSYLPYKPEIMGFFARVNGISRAQHPF
ncbi:uncharacterized protein LOC110024127 [Phalaenopsis equestris]|uniref:uncharacterized protein LOC110024127 n=1 Tax=Phalaenopsis equestris TaxID=78828 RepID=UPI0009E25A71|nr:uncharacterized protein LOC110024127 [Phalaenopsis equestris]